MRPKKLNGDGVYAQPRNARQEALIEDVGVWASYYRSNPHRFAKDFLHLELTLFQKILIMMMNLSTIFVWIASRGIGKTFISAVFCVIRCILYPGSKICVASGTRGQALTVLEKVVNEIKPLSPELAYEIDEKNTRMTSAIAQIAFKNGSYIKVVTARDSSRGNRANVLIIDEFRMVSKGVIDTILRKFLTSPRRPQYMNDPEYKDRADLREPNKTLYLSSAYYKDHWSYTRAKDACRFMLDDTRKDFVCGFPYQLALQEGLLMEETVIEQMTESDFNEISWSMEMCSLFWGDTQGSFFSYDTVSRNRKINYAMLPSELTSKIANSSVLRIPPKKNGEKRIISIDVALMASTRFQNDASSIFVNQALPTKAGRNIVYAETLEGMHTEDLALRIRKLFDEYACDYIVLDVRNSGLGVFDALIREMTDSDTGEVYPALACCNNQDLAARCTVRGAEKAIWAITASARFNSDCAILLREAFRSGRIRLLETEFVAEEMLNAVRGFASLDQVDRAKCMLPYANTTLLINELINLKHEESGGLIKISERSGMRKDRYSSLSYNYWVVCQLEQKLQKRASDDFVGGTPFMYRAPKIK